MGRTGHARRMGGSHHHRPPPRHHYHHGPPHRGTGGGCCNLCSICGTILIIFIVLLISLFSSLPTYIDTGDLGEYQLSNGEQYMKYTGGNKIKAEFNRKYISAYETKNETSLVINATKETYAYDKVKGSTRDVFYNSYFVTPQSYLVVSFKVDDDGELIIFRGEEQFKKFLDGRYYSSIYSATGSGTFTATISVFDEYFVVINPVRYNKRVSYEYTTTIDRTSYDVALLTPICEDKKSACIIEANSYAVFALKDPRTKDGHELSLSVSGLTTFDIVSISVSCVLIVLLVLVIVLICVRNKKAKKAISEEEESIISNSDTFVASAAADPNRTVVVIDDSTSSVSSSINSSSNGTKGESDPFLNSPVTVLPPPATLSYATVPPPGQYPPGQYPPPPPTFSYGTMPPPPAGQYPLPQQQPPVVVSYGTMPPPPAGQYPTAAPPLAGQYQPAAVDDYPVAPPPPGTIN